MEQIQENKIDFSSLCLRSKLKDYIILTSYSKNIRIEPEEIDRIINEHLKKYQWKTVEKVLPKKVIIPKWGEQWFSEEVIIETDKGWIEDASYDYEHNEWICRINGEDAIVKQWIEFPEIDYNNYK